MKIFSKFVKHFLLLMTVLIGIGLAPLQASAEIKEADLMEHDGGVLAFSFFYDVEKPDLVFVSPSGVEYQEGVTPETEMQVNHGEGWSSYRIENAEAGMWRFRYDKKGNESIKLMKATPVQLIAIQFFSLTGIENDVAHVQFNVRKGEENVRYYYGISLLDAYGNVVKENLATGWCNTMEEQNVDVPLDVSTGQDYKLKLSVINYDGGENYDFETTAAFSYTNANTPKAIADFEIKLESERSRCTVDWSGYVPANRGITYSIRAIADGDRENPIYVNNETEDTEVSFFYPTDAKKVEIELSYVQNGIISETKTKSLDLSVSEYLKIISEDVVGDALLPLNYSVKEQTELKVFVNGVEGAYRIDGEGVLYLSLQTGNNTVEATFVGANQVTYSVYKEVFYTWVSPTILFYENIDGMTFKVGKVPISGKVEQAVTLTVNGTAVEIAQDGSFYCEVTIAEGENVITVEAVSATGIAASQTITVYGEGKGAVVVPEDENGGTASGNGDKDEAPQAADTKTNAMAVIEKVTSNKWFPTAVVALIALVVLIFFFVAQRTGKKKKTFSGHVKKAIIWFSLLEVILGILYYRLYSFNNSMEYVELTKTSVQNAAVCMMCEDYGKYVLIGIGGIIVLLILILFIVGAIKKIRDKRRGQTSEQAIEQTSGFEN